MAETGQAIKERELKGKITVHHTEHGDILELHGLYELLLELLGPKDNPEQEREQR